MHLMHIRYAILTLVFMSNILMVIISKATWKNE